MKSFFKSVFASVIGIFTAIFILLIISVIILVSSGSSKEYKLQEDSVLLLDLNGVLKDRAETNPILDALGYGDSEIALNDILSSIQKAKENDKISGIYIRSGYFSASHASLQEIRNALKDFKESGKFIIAYGDVYLQGAYYLASVADFVVMNPVGNIDLHGIASSRTFYKDLFQKLGIEMQIFKVGTYKSAVEPYILDKMSTANREQVTAYINDIWNTLLKDISESREVSVEFLNETTDKMPLLRDAKLIANEYSLVDTLMYETEFKDFLAELSDCDTFESLNVVSVEEMKTVKSSLSNKKNKDEIAILYAEGSIMSGSDESDINDRFFVKQIEKLKNDDNVKAVVFRVNSPGGSAYASEQIWKAVSDLKAVKPIVVSMGGYAASGGYYISCNASKIIAQPTTLTGSIGIFGMFPNVEGLTKKVGLGFDNVKTNKFSDFGEIIRPMRNEEKEIIQEYINTGYDIFLTRCSDGRGIPKDSLAKIAEGRVWTGNQALEIGLVDALGGIEDAIKEAASLAETESYSLTEYPKKKGFWENLLSDNTEDIAIKSIKKHFGADYELIKAVKEIKELNETDFIQARLPYDFELK